MKEIHMVMMIREYYTTSIEKMAKSTKPQLYQNFLFEQYSKKYMITLVILALARLTH